MNRKRLISWSSALLILVFFAIYNLSMLAIKTQEVEAQCVRIYMVGCRNNATSCCGSAVTLGHVWCGFGVYNQYASLCSTH